MVTKEASNSISDDDIGGNINENGKRPSQDAKDGKKRFKTKSLYRQPTVNELNRLQETENLFNSNLFRLQVEEVLQEVKVKEKTEKKFQTWFEQFKTHLLSIAEDETEYDLSEQTLSKKLKIKLPVTKELSKTKCIFKFHKFSDVEIVGSYALGTSINSKLRVDLQITVPSDTFTKNDSINYRYHKKRAAYLAFIASHLTRLESVAKLTFTWLNGCETRPVIDLTPAGKLGSNLSVRIDLGCESDAYKLHRFSPSRNNLREAWLLSSDADNVTDVGPPTPYYNNSVLQDLNASLNNTYLKEIVGQCDNLKNAIILLKIWLRQRNLRVSGFVTSLIVAYLVQNKRVNNIMSSYQIVRNAWIYLKTSDWDIKGISLHKGQDTPSIEEFFKQFPVVFIDKSGYYNVCWQITLGTYQALKRECSLAVDMLDNPKINSFIPLFMTKMQPLTKFDHILCFKSLPEMKTAVLSTCTVESQVNFGVDRLALITDALHRLLAQGLGDRVHLILEIIEADFSWPVKKSADKVKKESYKEKLSFGLILNPENCMNIVEKGPPANLPEAEVFRLFWGDKSELRRFQDGSITEACVWDADTIADRRTITKQILEYLMQLKYDLPASSLFHVSEQLESLLIRRGCGTQLESACMDVSRSFDELRAELRGLTQLPLDVSAVYGTSAVFSYTCPVPPVPRGRTVARAGAKVGQTAAPHVKYLTQEGGAVRIPYYNPVAKVVLELGHSGKWPGDLEAFRCLKAAFHLQLSERLHHQYSLTTQAYPTHVDVLKNNLVFRLEIAHPKEITLLRREVVNGVVKFRETEESQELMMRTVLMPRLRGALHGLHQKYPSYGPTAALFKRWLSCQLLGASMPAAAPELLSAAVFVRAAPGTPPQSPTLAFVRVMRLLAETDWKNETLVLDFNGDMTVEEITSIEQQLSSSGRPSLCIVTSQDGSVLAPWTRASPSARALARVLTLATTTYKYLQEQLDNYNDNILGAFIPSLVGYDVLIHLRSELVPHRSERLDRAPVLRPPQPQGSTDVLPVVEFNVVEKYLQELRSAYGEFALFFHDAYGGDVIAVLWTPTIADTRELQIGNSNALIQSSKKGDQYKVNIEAIVEDFRIMGQGLVTDVVVNSS